MRLPHQSPRVPPQRLPDGNVPLADFIHLLPIRPNLVTRARRRRLALGLGLPVPMQPHHRTKRAPLEPARKQLPEGRVVRVPPMKAPNIRRPPGDPRNAHIQARGELVPERRPRRGNVAAPNEGAVFLAPRPRAPQQIDDIRLPGPLHALVERPRVLLGERVPDLHVAAGVVAVDVEVVDGVLGLCFVEPEDLDTLVVVVPFCGFPDELACGGVCCVEVGDVAVALHGDAEAAVVADEEALFEELWVIL